MVEEQKIEEQEQLLKTLAITRQLVHSKLAQFCDESRGIDLYYLYEVIQLLRSQFGEDLLKKKYGKKYEITKERLESIGVLLGKLKMFYDSIEKKELDDERKISGVKTLYKKGLAQIPLIQNLIFEVFFLYLENTNLKYQTIPSSYFKKMERKYKVVGEPEPPREEKGIEDEISK